MKLTLPISETHAVCTWHTLPSDIFDIKIKPSIQLNLKSTFIPRLWGSFNATEFDKNKFINRTNNIRA